MQTSTQTRIYLGDYVRDSYGRTGRVTEVHLFECPQPEWWIVSQEKPVTDEQRNGHWVSYLTHRGGSCIQPMDTLTVIEPFDLQNGWETEYFRTTTKKGHAQ